MYDIICTVNIYYTLYGICIPTVFILIAIIDLDLRERAIMSQGPISESMSLSRFVSEYKDRLPQAVAVTVGKEDTVRGGISSGTDIRVSKCIRESLLKNGIDRRFCFCFYCIDACMYVYSTCMFG